MNTLPRGKLLFDTSAYIRFIRESSYAWLAAQREIVERSLLTAVVAAELYAGARVSEDKEQIDALCRWHRNLQTLSSPTLDSWLMAGRSLRRYAQVFGAIRMADHFRDVLIALEAVRYGATLVTENADDFRRWQKLLRSSGHTLRIFDLRTLRAS